MDDLTARARIRDAALARFGADGVAGASVRAIAADAGVSPALVLHHFGSKEGLRAACDDHVLALIRGDGDGPAATGDVAALAEMLDAATPVRRYLARALVEGADNASALFEEIVESTRDWLARGEAEGWVRPTADPHARAVTYVAWLLAPLVLGDHVGRLLGGAPTDTPAAIRGARVGLEMLTHGLFSDARWLSAYSAINAGTNAGTDTGADAGIDADEARR
ncbi:transcriptional regulator, TetR family [Streptoalloteichus tenebrarius]|uniref:Transcriptional regulator, TetR family n=1 Tax=Streptoalloteichus tenebrarius (strain ATCC 17920 / DSM 40477 / JCM 4838 / CBS 697.72 / NBRC 16177 / NCIMB 11028 / NRRL B-12390 / A12253. 1 / ISP 5477) TaxID=1933 RepID=A0ABT1I448_STRSD|nr:TetR family transcriptional regulator [Streptoalloteichus tenebrarius]MCP2262524.1 transcriptional regulator, TetR family [Streptoalloteichus tenebrarius]BFE99120.1 transcriptional regulator RaaS [Streptoalloteichus tenebrarius]